MLVVLPLKESGVDSVDVKVRVVGQRDQRLYVVALLDYDTLGVSTERWKEGIDK